MRQYILFVTFILLLSGCGEDRKNSLMITIDSKYNFKDTISKFSDAISKKGYLIDNIIDYTKIAKSQNIYLKPTTSITLNNPQVFSALLTCNPSLAIDLPIRVSVYSDIRGAIKFSYTQPEYWSLKHNIKDKNCIAVVQQITRDFNEAAGAIIDIK